MVQGLLPRPSVHRYCLLQYLLDNSPEWAAYPEHLPVRFSTETLLHPRFWWFGRLFDHPWNLNSCYNPCTTHPLAARLLFLFCPQCKCGTPDAVYSSLRLSIQCCWCRNHRCHRRCPPNYQRTLVEKNKRIAMHSKQQLQSAEESSLYVSCLSLLC